MTRICLHVLRKHLSLSLSLSVCVCLCVLAYIYILHKYAHRCLITYLPKLFDKLYLFFLCDTLKSLFKWAVHKEKCVELPEPKKLEDVGKTDNPRACTI